VDGYISLSSYRCYSFFKVLTTAYCDIDKESNHIPEEERVFLLDSDKNLLLRDQINSTYATIHNTITAKGRLLIEGMRAK
jgi:hypothetical protein